MKSIQLIRSCFSFFLFFCFSKDKTWKTSSGVNKDKHSPNAGRNGGYCNHAKAISRQMQFRETSTHRSSLSRTCRCFSTERQKKEKESNLLYRNNIILVTVKQKLARFSIKISCYGPSDDSDSERLAVARRRVRFSWFVGENIRLRSRWGSLLRIARKETRPTSGPFRLSELFPGRTPTGYYGNHPKRILGSPVLSTRSSLYRYTDFTDS